MTISITPNELVERCLWYRYEKYVLKRAGKSDQEIQNILTENKEFNLEQKDALVIMLITSIETTNLQHKLNMYISNFLSIHVICHTDGNYYIRIKKLCDEIEAYHKNFPDYWNPTLAFQVELKNYKTYSDKLVDSIKKLDRIKIKDKKNIEHEYVSSTHVNKILNFVY